MAGETECVVVFLSLFAGMFLVMLYMATRYKRVPPNMAMVVYGRRMPGGKGGVVVVTGGGRVIRPIIEEVAWLHLAVQQVELTVESMVTDVLRSGVEVNILAEAVIKVTSDPEGLYVAAENLLGKSMEDIREIGRLTLEGHLRGNCATLTPIQIIANQTALGDKVRSMAAGDLTAMGIEIRSFLIKQVVDTDGYIAAFHEFNDPKRVERVRQLAKEEAEGKVPRILIEDAPPVTQPRQPSRGR